MAIGTTPLFSKISGSVGPIDYRTRRNGKIEIGKKRIPANPQSTEQQNTRNAYGRLHELWQNATWIDKTQYNNMAADLNISSWNAFLMRHLPIMRLNPVAYWPFVEGTDNTLHDFSTNNNHCTIYGPSWSPKGKYDIPELVFDGVDDYLRAPGSNSLANLTDQISLAVNVNIADVREAVFFRTPFNLSPKAFGLRRSAGEIRSFIYDGAAAKMTQSNWTPEIDADYQIGLDYDGTRIKAIINGAEYTGLNYVGDIDTTDKGIVFGTNEWPGATKFFKGTAREIFVFSYGMTDSQYDHLNKYTNKFYSD